MQRDSGACFSAARASRGTRWKLNGSAGIHAAIAFDFCLHIGKPKAHRAANFEVWNFASPHLLSDAARCDSEEVRDLLAIDQIFLSLVFAHASACPSTSAACMERNFPLSSLPFWLITGSAGNRVGSVELAFGLSFHRPPFFAHSRTKSPSIFSQRASGEAFLSQPRIATDSFTSRNGALPAPSLHFFR